MVPEEPYERKGFRGNVLFPGGMILEDDGEVKIHYGAVRATRMGRTDNIGLRLSTNMRRSRSAAGRR